MGKVLDELTKKYPDMNEEQRHLVQIMDTALDTANQSALTEMRSVAEQVKNEFPTEMLNSLRQEVENLKSERKKDFQTSLRSTLESKFEEIKTSVRERKPLEVSFANSQRAAVLMTVANTLTSDLKKHYAVDGGWDEIRYPENFIIDIIGGREVSVVPPIYKKKLEKAVEGNATLVAEGGLKPLLSTDFDVVFFDRVKYAGRFEINEEIKDFDELYNNIIEVIEKQVIRDYKAGTFTWLTTAATSYVSSAMDGTLVQGTATTGAALSAAALQIAALDYTPNVAYMNIADVEVSKWAQNTNGTFLLPPSDTLGSSLKIYADNSIPAGKVLVGDTSTVGEMHSPLIVRFGGYTSTAKFENNQEAAVVEIFSLPYLLTRNQGAWVYEDISVIKAAIELP